jgi:hypothetical protein
VSKTVGIGSKIAYVIHEHPLPLVFSVRKDWPEFRSILDKGLASIPDAKSQQIILRWTTTKVAQAEVVKATRSVLQLTREEQAWLAEQPVLNLGVDPSWAPFEYFDSKGELASITSDNIRILTQ